ncbi:hypothetical protein AB4254_11115 [Vibrio breoganii]
MRNHQLELIKTKLTINSLPIYKSGDPNTLAWYLQYPTENDNLIIIKFEWIKKRNNPLQKAFSIIKHLSPQSIGKHHTAKHSHIINSIDILYAYQTTNLPPLSHDDVTEISSIINQGFSITNPLKQLAYEYG